MDCARKWWYRAGPIAESRWDCLGFKGGGEEARGDNGAADERAFRFSRGIPRLRPRRDSDQEVAEPSLSVICQSIYL